MSDLSDIVSEFLVESHENLDQLDRDLVTLERDPKDRGTLASIFRTVHTLKGTSGFLGLSRLESIAHVGENLLSKLRDGVCPVTPDVTTALLALVDAIRRILQSIEATGVEGGEDHAELVALLTELQEHDGRSVSPNPSARAVAATGAEVSVETEQEATEDVVVEPPGPAPSAPPPEMELLPPEEALLATLPATDVAPPDVPRSEPAPPDPPVPLTRGGGIAETSVRVDVGLLDQLMTLVGELVLSRNQILQRSRVGMDPELRRASLRLDQITSSLQAGIMKTRMQPIASVWSKLPRLARDLAAQCRKSVRLELEGQETEMDRTVADALKDPLTHLIRNAIDHGIESPETRVARGKVPEGRLLLRAFHEGGQVHLRISDDGAGIDPARIRQRAIAHGLLTADMAARLAERELTNLVFLPGFSTAAEVTSVSGRGVGMDVVRTNIERIGGKVELRSRPGEGTTVEIRLPLTLAIVPALVVTARGQRFAIPQTNLSELIRSDGSQAHGVEWVQGAPVYRLHGRLLPLVYLDEQLRLPDSALRNGSRPLHLVVLEADERRFGLVVDEIRDVEEIVVKPLGAPLERLQVFSGATIMGDGAVALILDVSGLARRARVLPDLRERGDESAASATSPAPSAQLLLLGGDDGRQMALPLAVVARLEEFSRSRLERCGDRTVVQYHGDVLPLLRLGSPEPAQPASGDAIRVVVCALDGHRFGVIVDQILDVVEVPVGLLRGAERPGCGGAAVIRQRATELLDAGALWRRCAPSADPVRAVAA